MVMGNAYWEEIAFASRQLIDPRAGDSTLGYECDLTKPRTDSFRPARRLRDGSFTQVPAPIAQ
jgi:hypothetical protein